MKTTKYIPKCWERSVKRTSNPNFIRVKKKHFLIIIFYIYGPSLTIYYVSSLAVQFYCVRHKIFQLQFSYTMIRIAFFWELSHLCTDLVSSSMKVLGVFVHKSLIWSFIVSCSSLILLLPLVLDQFSHKHVLYCYVSASSDCSDDPG